MRKFKSIVLTTVALVCFMLAGCSKSDKQKEFENQAFAQPTGYTAINASGQIDSDHIDPDDWRISPDYQGFIEIDEKAHPNPVFINSRFEILLNIKYANNLSRIDVFAFQYPNEISFTIETIGEMRIYDNSFPNISIEAQTLPTDKLNNLYRILLTDQSGNVITYGDVKVNE